MTVEHVKRIESVTVSGDSLNCHVNRVDEFIVDGVVVASSVTPESISMESPVFSEVGGKLHISGRFIQGSHLKFTLQGRDQTIDLSEDLSDDALSGSIVGALSSDTLLLDVDFAMVKDDPTVVVSATETDADGNETEVPFTGVTSTLPAAVIPDDAKAVLQGIL